VARLDRISKATRAAAADAATPPPETAATPSVAPAKDLDDGKLQYDILHPEKLIYTLTLDEGGKSVERKIAVATQFTLHDLNTRRILDDMDAMRQLLFYEIRKLDPEASAEGRITAQLLIIAASKAVLRDALRSMIAKISTFTEPIKDERGNVIRDKPTTQEIALGMNPDEVTAFALWVLKRVNDEVEARKNAQRTAE
jgi:hypothetical protein